MALAEAVVGSFSGAILRTLIDYAKPMITRGRRPRRELEKAERLIASTLDQSSPLEREFRYALLSGLKSLKRHDGSPHLTDSDINAVMEFCRSEAGALLTRIIAANLNYSVDAERNVSAALAQQFDALWSLTRDDPPPGLEVSNTVNRIIGRLIREGLEQIRRASPPAYQTISRQVFSADNPLRTGLRGSDGRAEAISRLAKVLPSDMEKRIKSYLEAIREEVRDLRVPTLHEDLVCPIDELYLPRTVYERFRDTADDQRLLDHIVVNSRNVLLGDPGHGKTTETQAILHFLAEAGATGVTRIVPFRVTLRHYAEACEQQPQLSIVEYLARSCSGELSVEVDVETIRFLLHMGRALVIFDGLDELLNIAKRVRIVNRISRFSDAFWGVSILVTSRLAGYDEGGMGNNFVHWRLTDLTSSQVEEFAASIFAKYPSPQRRLDASRFMAQTSDISDIRSNPLMLGVLCNLYATGRTMPSNRVELYEKCADMLFEEWDARKDVYVALDDQVDTETAVRELALEVFRSNVEEFEERWLQSFLAASQQKRPGASPATAKRFAKATLNLWRGRRWLLVYEGSRDGRDYLRFSHRTFMEFFAAQQLVYETRSAEHLLEQLSRYMQERAALNFSHLAAEEFLSSRSYLADEFFELALKLASTLNQQSVVRAFNVVRFCVECLPFTPQATHATRLEVTRMLAGLFAQMIPQTPARRARAEGPADPREAILEHVSTDPVGDPDLDDDDPADPRLHMAVGSLWHFASAFLELSHLRSGDVAAHLGAIVSLCHELAADGQVALAVRLAVTLAQYASGSEWKESFGSDSDGFVTQLASFVKSRDLSDFDVNKDYYTVLVAMRLGSWPRKTVRPRIDLEDLLSTDWPVGEIPGVASVAVTLLAWIAGLRDAAGPTEPTPEWRDYCIGVVERELARNRGRYKVDPVATPDFAPLTHPVEHNSCPEILSERETVAAIALGGTLARLGAAEPMRQVLAGPRLRAVSSALNAVFDLAQTPQAWWLGDRSDPLRGLLSNNHQRRALSQLLGLADVLEAWIEETPSGLDPPL